MPARYDMQKTLGRGSYGSVHQAVDKQTGAIVAVKQMKRLFGDLTDCKRILRELAMLTRLDHPNVVRVHDIITPSDYKTFNELCLCLELCAMDLKKYIRQDVTLTMFQINTLMYHTLVGMQYVHACGIIHRDLKPANLLLVGPEGVVKICDFGLARAVAGEGLHLHPLENTPRGHGEDDPRPVSNVIPHTKNAKRVMTKHVVTRWYRAPELVLLQDGYTAAIDIWSIGCIYAELLSMLENGEDSMDRGPLFPGSSCYPLSPDRRSAAAGRTKRTRGTHDQLEVIFDVMGTPSEEDIKSISSDDAQKYLREFRTRPGQGLSQRLPYANEEALSLLAPMLYFDARRRLNIDQALENPQIVSLRPPGYQRITPKGPMVLSFEKESRLDESVLRRYFEEEITRFHELGGGA